MRGSLPIAARLRMRSGDIRTFPFVMVNPDGTIVDLTGYGDIDAEIYAAPGGTPTGSALVDENVAGDITITSAEDGEYELALAEGDTSALSGTHYLEIQAEDGSGNERTVLRALLEIEEDLITA